MNMNHGKNWKKGQQQYETAMQKDQHHWIKKGELRGFLNIFSAY